MTKEMMHIFFNSLEHVPFQVRYWDGETHRYNEGKASVMIIFNQELPPDTNWTSPSIVLGEAYMDDMIDLEGSMEELLRLLAMNREKFNRQAASLLAKTARLLSRVLEPGNNDSEKNIQHHYDVGNDFYALWLDPTMSYSCAYFAQPDDSLEEAQRNKISHTLKKLQLKPGEKILDIGSGWGWLLIEAAEKYGVTATGVTLSEEQYLATQERISGHGLQNQVEVLLADYRTLDQSEYYDKIVSVGMFEHVGEGNHGSYFQKVNQLLKPGGISLLHSIMGHKEATTNLWMTRHIFPGGHIPSLRETIHYLPEYDFHLLHTESLRLHYAKTLDHWLNNYLRHWDTVVDTYGRRFARMWKLYLMGCAANFRVSGLNVYQLVFSKGLNNQLETTLQHVYR
ncbi:MAG: cyclopropane-fatty-acyl-phospholipid synthase family protein [Bacillota bacterium]|nr:cyclopropane-fatty-acyl-phospholipid synthase family protein [Bacillota bacterium]MDW7678488.1 cyclopropane-fatty-acyl-phospholipid synthase family protein [Bacillota bacterium]